MTASDSRKEQTVSDLLAALGLVHQPGDNGRRYLSGPTGPLGLMSAEEAVNLLDLMSKNSCLMCHSQGAIKRVLERER